MKKLMLTLVFIFAMGSFTQAKTLSVPDEAIAVSCWAGAERAEVICCGSVGCSFALFSAVMDACLEIE